MTAPLRVVVIDDEPLAREGLAASIAHLVASGDLPPCTVVATADSGVTGAEAIRRHVPDVALVDVAMPRLGGLAMLERLEPEATPPVVIVVTAYTEHALDAFGVHALDYLVKPVPERRLRDALLRAARRVAEVSALRASLEPSPPIEPRSPTRHLERLVIAERGVRVVIPVEDIEWIEGETYYVRVHARGRSRLLRERLGALEAALEPERFVRVHRSAIVRLDLVREIRADSAYASSVVLSTGARVPLSRDRQKRLEELLRGQSATG